MVNRMRYGGTHADDTPPRTGAVYCQFCGQPLKVIGQKRFCNNTRCLNRYNDV
nr:MAG TPA: Polyhomeotic-like protein 1 BINDING PROTEIN [Caudoviricetes sp.]